MKKNVFSLLFTLFNFLSFTGQAQFSQPGELDTTFNFGLPHRLFTVDPANPRPGEGANTGVRSLAIQPDGKVLIGGAFNSYNGTVRHRIARLNPDGSLDSTFNPGTGAQDQSFSEVRTLATQPDGKVLIGGSFTTYNGTLRKNIARLNANGSLDTSFKPGTGASSWVTALALQPDGKVLIGGLFTSYNGTSRNYIARLNPNGSLDATFNPNNGPNSYISSLALQPDGKVLIGGEFTSYNGTSRNRIARLNADGSLDANFNPGTGVNGFIASFSLQPDGKILIAGVFTSYNSTSCNRIARLNPDGSIDTTFNPGNGANSNVASLALQPDGKVLIGGEFATYNGTPRKGIARLNADGSLDATFNAGTGVNGFISSFSLQPDGKILIAGVFTSYNRTSRNRIARLNADGSLDATFNPVTGTIGQVLALALQPDGKVLIGGWFNSFNGISCQDIARLNPNGSLDTTFNPGTGTDNFVRALALQPDGKVLIVGDFTTFNDTPRNRITRLNADGSLDATFIAGTGADNEVHTIAFQPDGKLLIGGEFSTYNGTPRKGIARLNSDGSLDGTFNPGTGANIVYSLALQPDGGILIGGNFTSYNGTPRNCIARLNADGSLDATFNPGTGTNSVYSLVLQPDGKVLIGGEFTSYNGTPRLRIARLNTDGSLDATFNPGTGAQGGSFVSVKCIGLQPDGKVLIVGNFTNFNNTPRNRIARLNADGSLDLNFNPGTGALGGQIPTVYSLALLPQGKALIVGDFDRYNGIYRSKIARIIATGATTGLRDEGLKDEQNFSFYPVPFRNALTIKAEAPFQYEIMDVRGVMKASGTSQSPEATCNTGNLATGMYLVKITVKGKSFIRKIVRE